MPAAPRRTTSRADGHHAARRPAVTPACASRSLRLTTDQRLDGRHQREGRGATAVAATDHAGRVRHQTGSRDAAPRPRLSRPPGPPPRPRRAGAPEADAAGSPRERRRRRSRARRPWAARVCVSSCTSSDRQRQAVTAEYIHSSSASGLSLQPPISDLEPALFRRQRRAGPTAPDAVRPCRTPGRRERARRGLRSPARRPDRGDTISRPMPTKRATAPARAPTRGDASTSAARTTHGAQRRHHAQVVPQQEGHHAPTRRAPRVLACEWLP